MPGEFRQPNPRDGLEPDTGRSPATLLQRVAAGDASAIRPLIDAQGSLVWSMVRARLSGPARSADAEEVVQDVFASIWQNAHRFDPSMGSERAFIAVITRRRIIDRLRRSPSPASTTVPPHDLDRYGEAPGLRDTDEDIRAAARAYESLPQPQKIVLRLFITGGHTHQQISDATGLPIGTVKSHIRRGLHEIRAAIETPSEAPIGKGVAP